MSGKLKDKLEFFSEIWSFAKSRKKYWLVPLLAILVALGFLIVFAQTSAVAPFIYTLF